MIFSGFDDSSYEINLNTSQDSSMSEDFESETGDKVTINFLHQFLSPFRN